jgi:hypothetical protein
VIKRVHLVSGDVGAVVARLAEARPPRLAVNRVLTDRSDPGTGIDAVVVEWLAVGATAPDSGPDLAPSMAVEEVVLRGADWLEQRWRTGGDRHKHLALATRSPGLTPADFAERWRTHAGTVSSPSGGPAVPIPDAARGRAYVQDHPVLGADGSTAPFDGLNEVWFDDLAGLDARRAWFAEHGVGRTDDGLFAPATYLAAVETLVVGQPRSGRPSNSG